MPKRIQRQRTKGWRMPPYTIYVGRPTQWGNPFKAAAGDEPGRVVAAFRALMTGNDKWFRTHSGYSWTAGLIYSMTEMCGETMAERSEKLLAPLRGMDLACWCQLDKPCHADVLLELANAS